jgi:endonuclease III
MLPIDEARRALSRFPMIGEPGADRILVLAGSTPALPLDSNALRVLQRLGLAPEAKDYRSAYRAAQAAVTPALTTRTASRRLEAADLLRRHGQEICRRSAPRCEVCPIRDRCAFFARAAADGAAPAPPTRPAPPRGSSSTARRGRTP